MSIVLAALAGLVFGLGIVISGMANPAKVLAFLDLGGAWDPSLMLVMGGAIAVGLVAFAWAARRNKTWLGLPFSMPTASDIDKPLVLGSLAFGAGWGLAGFCPGPALVSLGAWQADTFTPTLIFVAAMAAGMLLFDILQKRLAN